MQVEPSWFLGILAAAIVAFFSFKIKQKDDSQKELVSKLTHLKEEVIALEGKVENLDKIKEDLLEQRDSLTVLQSTAVNEMRAREIANEVVQPLKRGQDEIKQDLKEMLKEISNLSQLVAEVKVTSRRN